MKKMLVAGLVAVALVAAVEQRASAWTKFSFGVGMNTSYEGGGNSLLWGLIKGAPSPTQMALDPSLSAPPMGGGGYSGQVIDGSVAPISPMDAPKPLPKDPEKLGPPTPLKPAAFFQLQQTQPNQANENSQEDPEYYYPSYYYGR